MPTPSNILDQDKHLQEEYPSNYFLFLIEKNGLSETLLLSWLQMYWSKNRMMTSCHYVLLSVCQKEKRIITEALKQGNVFLIL